MHQLLATLEYDFSPVFQNRFFGAAGIGPRGELLALSTSQKLPRYPTKWTGNTQIHRAENGEIQTLDVAPGGGYFHFVQPWGDDQFLLVHARGDGDNAFIIDSEGFCTEKFALGDAIEDVQIAKNGNIWVSYFDEAMGDPNGMDGLRCLNAARSELFNFNLAVWKDKNLRADTICDCYMLNVVSNQEVWLCPYTGFPLHHLREFELVETLSIPNEMVGSYSFAISRSGARRLLFVGGYHFKNRLFWHELATNQTVELQVLDENAEPFTPTRVQSRADAMWVWNEAKAYRLRVDEVWPL